MSTLKVKCNEMSNISSTFVPMIQFYEGQNTLNISKYDIVNAIHKVASVYDDIKKEPVTM
jgi:hypothetical protein